MKIKSIMKEIRNIKESDDESEYLQQYESAPNIIKGLIDTAGEQIENGSDAYKTLKALNMKLNSKGWQIEYGLDGEITALTKK